MKLCTVCGLLTSRAGSRCTSHARQSNRSRHNSLYSTRAWQRLSARVLRTWRGEHGHWCPGYGRPAHPAADLTVDHVVPLAAGGATFDIGNTAALRFAKDRDLGQLEATMARLDAEAEAAVVARHGHRLAAEARAYLESLPDLWAKTSDAGRHAIAEAVFERIDVLGVTDYTFTLTAHAKAHGWDAAFGAGDQSISIGRSGRGEKGQPRDHRPSGHDAARRAARAVRLAAERMTRPPRHAAERATDREVGVVVAVLSAGSEKAAAHHLGLSHSTVKHHLANARSKVGAATTAQLVWIFAPRLPEPEARARTDE